MSGKLAAAVIALSIACPAGAQPHPAQGAVAADAVSTAVALAAPGVVELNPLGWATVPLRLAAIEHAKRLPREEGQPILDAISAGGWAAAANNLLVLAGASGAAGPLVAMVVGYAMWNAGAAEREFWRMCAEHKRFDPGVTCRFEPKKVKPLEMEMDDPLAAPGFHPYP